MFSWLKTSAGPPDSWTPDRVQRATLLAHLNGDVTRATAELVQHRRGEFLRFLKATGRISEEASSARRDAENLA